MADLLAVVQNPIGVIQISQMHNHLTAKIGGTSNNLCNRSAKK